ncbi:MAG: integron integrase [Verrucomicrobiales bacterium]|nr:integron integrase [Verrucomicrobiales bacterium]
MSLHTEDSYAGWYRRFVRYHQMKHPGEMGADDVSAFLTHLAVIENVAPSTQNQALNALVFLYRHVLEKDLEGIDAVRPKKGRKLPVVLSVEEVGALLPFCTGTGLLQTRLLYGCGIRLNECLHLRAKDIDLDRQTLWVRAGKGNKDRCLELPDSVVSPLRDHLRHVRTIYDSDRKNASPRVYLPFAYERKEPSATTSWEWFWLFPSKRISNDPRTGQARRHHIHSNTIGSLLKKAARKSGKR